MGLEDANRLAGLHQQRLVRLQIAQRRDDAIKAQSRAARPMPP
jgi:hypothetical protein